MKAATAAAKSKGGCRQRTSVNSNKNKDEQTSDCEEEEEEDKMEEEDDPESERPGILLSLTPLRPFQSSNVKLCFWCVSICRMLIFEETEHKLMFLFVILA